MEIDHIAQKRCSNVILTSKMISAQQKYFKHRIGFVLENHFNNLIAFSNY